MTQPIRSLLSVPGLRERFIHNAQQVPADIIVLDLEDSIASARKAEARELVRGAIGRFEKHGKRLSLRGR